MLRKIALSLTLCLLCCLTASAQDRSTPEATVRSFVAAFGRADMDQATACVKGVKMSPASLTALGNQIKSDPAVITLMSAKTALNGTSATVSGQVRIKPGKSDKTQNSSTSVNLVSTGGKWQIVPDAGKAQRNDNVDLVNGLAYMLTDTKVMTRAHDSARGAACLSNMKQICLGAIMLAQDSDEKFKLTPGAYQKGLAPYVKNTAIFACPDDSGGMSYAFNGSLAGVSLAKIKSPAETVLFYEGKNGKLEFRHEGKATVGFADGHGKLVDAESAKQLRWKP